MFGRKFGRKMKKFGRTLRRGLPQFTKALGRGGRNLLHNLGETLKGDLTALTARGFEKVANTQVGGRSIGDMMNMAVQFGRDPNELIRQAGGALGRSALSNPASSASERVGLLQQIGSSAE